MIKAGLSRKTYIELSINTFFAETTGNYAKAALGLKLEVGMTVNVHLVVDARKWQTQQGEDRYENRVTITNIARW